MASGSALLLGIGSAGVLVLLGSTTSSTAAEPRRAASPTVASSERAENLPAVPDIPTVPSETAVPTPTAADETVMARAVNADQARNTVLSVSEGKASAPVVSEFKGEEAWSVQVTRPDGSVVTGYVSARSGAVLGWEVLREPDPVVIVAAPAEQPAATPAKVDPPKAQKPQGSAEKPAPAADSWTGSSGANDSSSGSGGTADKDRGDNSRDDEWDDDHEDDRDDEWDDDDHDDDHNEWEHDDRDDDDD